MVSPDQVTLWPLSRSRHPVQRGEQPVVRAGRRRACDAGEPTPVHAVVDFGVDALCHVVDLGAQRLGVQLGCAVAVVCRPFRRQVERDLGEVVGDDPAGGHVDDGRDGDALRVVWESRLK